nr:histone acetyltransferase mst2 [Quercus suber]
MEYDEDADAEVAEVLDDDEGKVVVQRSGLATYEEDEGSDADAEIAEDDEDEGEFVGAVKTRASRSRGKRKAEEDDSTVDGMEEDRDSEEEEEEESSNDGGPGGWDGADDDNEDDVNEDVEVGNASANRCMTKNMIRAKNLKNISRVRCAVIMVSCAYITQQEAEGKIGLRSVYRVQALTFVPVAHRQCARDAGSHLASDEGTCPFPDAACFLPIQREYRKLTSRFVDAARWRCQGCIDHDLQPEYKNVVGLSSTRRRSSAPRMARDLLPAARGGIKPDSHSVFNTLILDEDPLDGSRSLRKRKTPSDEFDELPRPLNRKRRRTHSLEGRTSEIEDEIDSVGGFDGAEDGDAGSPRSRSGRPQRNLKQRKRGARILSRSNDPKSAVMVISVTPAQWDQIEREVQKKQKRRERDRLRRIRNSRQSATAEPLEEVQHFPAVQTSMYSNPFYAFPDRETDESKGKPYGGILTDAEADTTRTFPQDPDRQAFQDARDRAERLWKEKMSKVNNETPARSSKSSGPASKIKCINFGQYEIDTWHAAPYPEEYSRNKHLYICEFCLKYMSSDYVAWRHKLKCSAKHPPGDEIYRQDIVNPESGAETTLSFFEVDGRRNPLYCQNLCLLAKLFLGSKTLYYDVEPFLFYIMTENDEFGCHFVGYFSKEKRGCAPAPPMDPHTSFDDNEGSQENQGADSNGETVPDPVISSPGNNVSCILVLPVHMRRGFGRILIEFSYMLTKVECRTGSPEKPLSDMGLISYRSYWRTVLCGLLLRYKKEGDSGESGEKNISVVQIAKETGMTPDDIISTLEALRFLVRDPITRTYALRLDYDYMQEYVEKHKKKATIELNPTLLCWTPYVMGRPTNFFTMGEEANQPLQTVAPREDTTNALPSVPMEGVEVTAQTNGDADKSTENVPHHLQTTEPAEETLKVNGFATEPRKGTPPTALALTPQPSFTGKEQPNGSPSRPSPQDPSHAISVPGQRTRSISPSSYFSGSQSTSAGSIPPTRFEVFPPVPGMAASVKRRPGRPPRGNSRRSYGSTPIRRLSNRPVRSPATEIASGRRTRSKLGNVTLSINDEVAEAPELAAADDHAEDIEGGEEDAEGEEDEQILYE